MQKKIHAICKCCYKIYKNIAIIETKKPVENLRIFTCANCIIKQRLNSFCLRNQ